MWWLEQRRDLRWGWLFMLLEKQRECGESTPGKETGWVGSLFQRFRDDLECAEKTVRKRLGKRLSVGRGFLCFSKNLDDPHWTEGTQSLEDPGISVPP